VCQITELWTLPVFLPDDSLRNAPCPIIATCSGPTPVKRQIKWALAFTSYCLPPFLPSSLPTRYLASRPERRRRRRPPPSPPSQPSLSTDGLLSHPQDISPPPSSTPSVNPTTNCSQQQSSITFTITIHGLDIFLNLRPTKQTLISNPSHPTFFRTLNRLPDLAEE